MMAVEQYIEAEFRRYFPSAKSIQAIAEEESILVLVYHQVREGVEPTRWYFECGSDDGYFSFSDGTGEIITVPLMKEEP